MPATLVIPCFNEAERLDQEAIAALLRHETLRLLFVDDGSTDDTGALLESLRARHGQRIDILRLGANRGKGEAVFAGLRRALKQGAELVAYTDADFATAPDEILRLIAVAAADPQRLAVLGSRVARLGAHIERRPVRHYMGRLFATAASLVVGAPVYDTQCGTKVFRRSAALQRALARPFVSRWAFDVELIGRLLQAAERAPDGVHRVEELPLRRWRDVGGSKLGPAAMLRAGLDLGRIAVSLRSGGDR